MPTKNENIKESMDKLEAIVSWFDEQKEADVEEGLKKVKEGAFIIKALKERLKEVENEFVEIKKEMEA